MTVEQQETECPVCTQHGELAAYLREGMVLSLMEAFVARDGWRITLLSEEMDRFGGHVAATLATHLLWTLAEMTGQDIDEVLADYRKQINAKIATLST